LSDGATEAYREHKMASAAEDWIEHYCVGDRVVYDGKPAKVVETHISMTADGVNTDYILVFYGGVMVHAWHEELREAV